MTIIDEIGREVETDCDLRLMPCPACGGDRGWAYPVDIDRRDGSLIERWEDCRYCDENGEVEVELEPIELDDLDEAAASLMEGRQ